MTHEELRNIALVPTQIISPSKCKPIITLLQDTLVGAYLMTQDNSTMNRRRVENMLMNIRTFNGQINKPDGKNDNDYWTGKNVYSMILPDISLNLKNNSDQHVVIKNGNYLSGALDSSIIGSRGLIQDILNTYGTDRTHAFLDETQNIVTRWLEEHGFSVGVGDAVPATKEIRDKIEEIIESKVEESKEQITLAYQGLYEQNLDEELRLKSMDMLLQKIASDCENEVVKYVKKTLNKGNRFKTMVTSGAKGKDLNIRQIMGIVGQTSIWGARIPDGFDHRTLPHFHKYDFGLSAKGFIRNSFVKGLNPSEFFFAMMGGRTGMIDTAVRSVTGDCPIVITENGKARRVLIGEWIDNYLDNEENQSSVEHYDARNLELFRTDSQEIYIPTTDEKGNVSWGKVTALTRHDPGERLYKITTLGGRDVIVSEAKSLLVWNEETKEFLPKDSPDVKVGDYVPVTCNLPKNISIENNNIQTYFNKYGDIYDDRIEFIINSEEDFSFTLMSLTMHDIFSKIDGNKIIIESQWAKKLIELLGSKNIFHDTDNTFIEQNDTVLDKIESINIIGTEDYPKLYDLTVPSTLNFNLANGLGVVDQTLGQQKVTKSVYLVLLK